MISAADVAAMRLEQEAWLDGTATIYTATRTSDSAGSSTVAWVATGTAACRLMPMSARESVWSAAVREAAEWVVTLPHSVTVTHAQRIVVDGRTLDVVGVENRHSIDTATRAACVEVR